MNVTTEEFDEIDLNCTNLDYGTIKKENGKKRLEESGEEEVEDEEEEDQINEPEAQETDEAQEPEDEEEKEPEEEDSDSDIPNIAKRKRTGKGKVDDKVLINEATSLIRKIYEAVTKDQHNYKQKKPSLEKILLIPKLIKKLKNKELVKHFLDYKGLEYIFHFIQKLPDGNLPLNQYRTNIFTILRDITVTSSQLKEGSILVQELKRLQNDRRETKENKKIIGKILEKWARTVCQKNMDYYDLETEEREKGLDKYRIQKKCEEESLLRKRNFKEFSTGYDKHRVYRPKRMGYEFFRRPVQGVIEKGSNEEKPEYRIRKFICDLKMREKKKI